MGTLVLNGATSGSTTIQPTDAATVTATLPGATGTIMVSGNMPAFSAYLTGNQSISATTYTKVQLNTKTFDTNNCFDSTTNYRFTPTVAGYYQVNITLGGSNAAYQLISAIYKNGSAYLYTSVPTGTGNGNIANGSCLIYLNGSTDYIEFYGWQSAGGVFAGGSVNTQASATLVRAA